MGNAEYMGHISNMDLAPRDASPNKLRIRQLSDKLSSLQDEMDHEKQARSDATELKLKVLDDKLLRAQITEEEKPAHSTSRSSASWRSLLPSASPARSWMSARPRRSSLSRAASPST